MKSTIEELGPTRVRMAIEVPWGDLDHAFGEVYKELGKQVRVPGFRPGKVPNRVLDQRIGRPVVLEQVVQHAIPEVYSEVVRENQVRVLGQPEIEVTRLDDNDTLAFTAEVDVAPQLELPALENLAVTVDDVEVTDEEIDQQVSVMRERFGMLTGVERAGPGRRLRLHRPRGQAQRRGARGRLDHRHVLRGRLRQPHGGPRRRRPRAVGRRVEDLPDGAAVRPQRRRVRRRDRHGPLGEGPRTCRSWTTSSPRPRASSTPWPSCATTSAPGWPAPRPWVRARRPATSWSST